MTIAPLPCPFCGFVGVKDEWIRDGRRLSCIGCNVSMVMYNGPGGPSSASKALLEKWNRRAKK